MARIFALFATLIALNAPARETVPASGDKQAMQTPLAQQEYPLGSGDTLRVQVFQNPDLTVETRVSENGVITYPLIGTVEVGGLSLAAAERKIADALEAGGFVRKPQVNIVILQVHGNQVSVLGQVVHPGRFPLQTLNTRVSDMLAAAGGTTPEGDDVIIVTGLRDGKPFRREIDIPRLYIEGRPEDDIKLSGGDTIFVRRAPVFYIYGEVQDPGPYRIERGMTVMQALAKGGGPTPRGSESRLRLHRRNAAGAVEKSSPEMTDPVQANDVINVGESIF